MNQGVLLKIFVPEERVHGEALLYEWILERAKALGIPGGTAFRAIAGYGRHGSLHQEGFIDLMPNLPIQVQFVATEEQAQQLLNLMRAEQISAFYVRSPVELGFTAEPRTTRG